MRTEKKSQPREMMFLSRNCARRQRAWGIRNPGFLAWGSTLAAAAYATGRTAEALDAADEQIEHAVAFGVAREHGMGLLALLDAGLLYVVYAAQYAFIFSQKHEHLAAHGLAFGVTHAAEVGGGEHPG